MNPGKMKPKRPLVKIIATKMTFLKKTHASLSNLNEMREKSIEILHDLSK